MVQRTTGPSLLGRRELDEEIGSPRLKRDFPGFRKEDNFVRSIEIEIFTHSLMAASGLIERREMTSWCPREVGSQALRFPGKPPKISVSQ